MKYLIVGAGAMGSILAAFLTRAGKDLTLIARGENLEAIRESGLRVHTPPGEEDFTAQVRAVSENDYDQQPDVVIICVKSYSLDSVYPLLDRVCREDTIVLPIQNALRIGERIAAGMSQKAQIIEGISYVAVMLIAPGEVKRKLDFFRIVFGMRAGEQPLPELQDIRQDLEDCGPVTAEVSDNMLKSALQKFVRVSTLSAAEVLYDTDAGGVRENPDSLQFLMDLGQEIVQIAEAAGMPLDGDPLGGLRHDVFVTAPADYRTSLMYDYMRGRPVEKDTQFFGVYELGRELGLEMTAYAKICRKLGYQV